MTSRPQINQFQSATGIDGEQVSAQLERILSSRTFEESPRLRQFLRYVVDQTLDGNASRIKGFTIASDVFKRADSDNTQASTIVRVEAGRLRRLIDDYYKLEGHEDPIRIHIPKGAYVPNFELASIEEESSVTVVADSDQRTHKGHRDFVVIALASVLMATLALLAFLVFRPLNSGHSEMFRPQAGTVATPSIAVMPFSDATKDGSGVSMAAGLTEDIITDLSTISSIDVIALTSVLPYRDKSMSPDQIASELRVTHILIGSVRGSKEHLRITTQLFESETGKEIWAERADHDLNDELALQGELALKTVEGMAVVFQNDERTRLQREQHLRSSEAYSLFKQAMNMANPPSDPRRLRVAGRVFDEVIEAAPEFVGGYAGAAYIHAFQAFWGHSTNRQKELEATRSLAQKAIAIDPEFGLTQSALAFVFLADRDFDRALIASSEAIRIQPNDPYVSAYHGFILCASGDPEQGIPHAQRAIRLDPAYPRTPFRNILGIIYFHAGHYQKALHWFERSDELGGPRSPGLIAYHAATYALLGRHQEARTNLDLLYKHNGDFDWKSWTRRTFKYEKYAEQLINPLRELESKPK